MEDRWIIEKNIEHYRRLMKTEMDDDKRTVLEHLLAQAVARLPAPSPSVSVIGLERKVNERTIDVNSEPHRAKDQA